MDNVNPSDVVEIMQKYKAYIMGMCRRFYIAGGTSEDLFEEGVIGLLEACKNYNGQSLFEERFESFAKLCIRRQIFDAIKKSNTLKNKALNESISLMHTDEFGEEFSKLELFMDRTTSNDPLELFIDKEVIDERMKIEELTKMKCDEIVFDSDICDWSIGQSTFDKHLFGKMNVAFFIEDINGNKISGFVKMTEWQNKIS